MKEKDALTPDINLSYPIDMDNKPENPSQNYPEEESSVENFEEILSDEDLHQMEEEQDRIDREEHDRIVKELIGKAEKQSEEIDSLKEAIEILKREHSESTSPITQKNIENGEDNGDNGNGERTPSGFDINEPIHVIIERYSGTALEQKKQVMMEVADYLVRNLSEAMEGISEKSHQKFMDAYGKLSLENQQNIITGLQAAKWTARETMNAAEETPKSQLELLKEYIEKIDTENGPNTTEAIEKLLKPEGHLALTIKNINNVLGRLDDEDLQELAQDQREWLDDLTSSVEGEDITPDEALSQIRDKMPEIEDVYKRAGEKVQRLRREVQEKGEERERSERQEGFRRQQVWSIVDIAEGIEANNESFAEGGEFPILVTLTKDVVDENGEIKKEVVYGTRKKRDEKGRIRVGKDGKPLTEVVPVRDFNEENFLRWVRDRMIFLHNEDPDSPNINFFSISVDLPQFFRAFNLLQMIRDKGRYFNHAPWVKDENGNWVEGEEKVLDKLVEESTRHAWLFGAMRSMYISYVQAMPMDTKIGETLMNIYQNNTLTKEADDAKSPLYWIMTIPEHFKEEESTDMNVGEAIRTALLTYRSITDYPELERIWGKDSILFKKETISKTIREIMKKNNFSPDKHFLNPHRISEINSWFDENGNLKKGSDGKVKPDIQIAFTDFLNIFSPENVANESKIVREMVRKALAEKYGFKGVDDKGFEKTDTQSLEFAEWYALFMSRPMLFGGRNDRGAAAMDASAKTLRMGQNRSRKYSQTSAGSSGNPYDSVLLEAASVDFLESVQTTSSSLRKKYIEITDRDNDDIKYSEEGSGILHTLQPDEEIIEIPQGYEIVVKDDGLKTIQKINYEIERIELKDNWEVEEYDKEFRDQESGDTRKIKKYRIVEKKENNDDGNHEQYVRENLDPDSWEIIKDNNGRPSYMARPDYAKLEGNYQAGKVVVEKGTAKVIRQVDKELPLQIKIEGQGITKSKDKYNFQDSEHKKADDANYVVYEVRFNSQGRRVLVENTYHKETILDVLEMMEEAKKRGKSQNEMLEIASRLNFKEDATRQLTSNQYNRAFQLFLMLNDAEEIEISNYVKHSPQKGVEVDKKQLQNDFTERFIKPLRYAFKTWNDLDFSRIVRSPDPESGYKSYKYMHLAEAMFGKQVVEVFRGKDGAIDWDFFDTSDGKSALFKTYSALYLSAQIWHHRSKHSTAPWISDTEVEAFLEVLEEIPGGISVDREDFKKTKITDHFYGHFAINRKGEEKEYMDIIKKSSHTEKWRLVLTSFMFDMLEAFIKGGAEAMVEGAKATATI